MRLHPLWAALTIALIVSSCAQFSTLLTPAPPAALARAEARVDKALDCPQQPSRLLTCQDGSLPLAGTSPDGSKSYSCPWPALDAELAAGVPLKEVLADMAGTLRKETNLRFTAQHWDDQCRPPPAPPTSNGDK